MLTKLLLWIVLCSLSDESLSKMGDDAENADEVVGL